MARMNCSSPSSKASLALLGGLYYEDPVAMLVKVFAENHFDVDPEDTDWAYGDQE